MLQRAAVVFGVVFLIVGVLGFIPLLTPGGRLLGLFEVDAWHNAVHLLTGAIGVAVGWMSERGSQLFFQIFGVLYGLLAVLGFFYADQPLLGFIAHNQADVGLHLVIALVALYLGFAVPATRTERV